MKQVPVEQMPKICNIFNGNGDDSMVLYKEKKCHKSSHGHERYRGALRVVYDIF